MMDNVRNLSLGFVRNIARIYRFANYSNSKSSIGY